MSGQWRHLYRAAGPDAGAVLTADRLVLRYAPTAIVLRSQSPIARTYLVLALLQGLLSSCRARDVAAANPEIHA